MNPYLVMAYVISLLVYILISFGSLLYVRDESEKHINRFARWKSQEEMELPYLPAAFIFKRVVIGFIPIINICFAIWHMKVALDGLKYLKETLPMPPFDKRIIPKKIRR